MCSWGSCERLLFAQQTAVSVVACSNITSSPAQHCWFASSMSMCICGLPVQMSFFKLILSPDFLHISCVFVYICVQLCVHVCVFFFRLPGWFPAAARSGRQARAPPSGGAGQPARLQPQNRPPSSLPPLHPAAGDGPVIVSLSWLEAVEE